MKVNFKGIFMLILIIAVMIAAVSIFSVPTTQNEKFTYKDLLDLFDDDLVHSFVIDSNAVISVNILQPVLDSNGEQVVENGVPKFKTKADGKPDLLVEKYELTYSFQIQEITNKAESSELKNLTDYDIETPPETPWYQLYLPYIIVGILLIIMTIFVFRSAGAGGKMSSFSKSKARIKRFFREQNF